jgi:hypothetical protein
MAEPSSLPWWSSPAHLPHCVRHRPGQGLTTAALRMRQGSDSGQSPRSALSLICCRSQPPQSCSISRDALGLARFLWAGCPHARRCAAARQSLRDIIGKRQSHPNGWKFREATI